MNFKQFMLDQPDHVLPKEAEILYKRYLMNQAGDAKKAWFHENSTREDLRDRYHPSRIPALLKKRDKDAKTSAHEFLGGPPPADGNGGDKDMADADAAADGARGMAADDAAAGPPAASEEPDLAPPEAWRDTRLAKDLTTATELVRKADAEKSIAFEADVATHPVIDAASTVPDDGFARLDAILSYLWKVHGVDYYGGTELSLWDFSQRTDRQPMRRGPRPEATTPEQVAALDADEAGKKWAAQLELAWEQRLAGGDPAAGYLGETALEEGQEAYVKGNVQVIDDSKFMCKLCTKLFKGEEFVCKHIKNKHSEMFEHVKADIMNKVYMANFMSDKSFNEHERDSVFGGGGLMRTAQGIVHVSPMGAGPQGGAMGGVMGPGFNFSFSGSGQSKRKKKAYVDLDEQKDTRVVLDYGDI